MNTYKLLCLNIFPLYCFYDLSNYNKKNHENYLKKIEDQYKKNILLINQLNLNLENLNNFNELYYYKVDNNNLIIDINKQIQLNNILNNEIINIQNHILNIHSLFIMTTEDRKIVKDEFDQFIYDVNNIIK